MIPDNLRAGRFVGEKKLYDKGVKITETAVGTLGPNQVRHDLASPDATPAITATASSWSNPTELYTVPEGYHLIIYYFIVSLTAAQSGNYADVKLLRRPKNGTSSDDKVVGRSSFASARSITYPAGQLFKPGEKILLQFYNPYGSGTLTFNYFIHGIKEWLK